MKYLSQFFLVTLLLISPKILFAENVGGVTYVCKNYETNEVTFISSIELCKGTIISQEHDYWEQIKNFDVTLVVNQDNSVNVTEKIVYQTEKDDQKRGIFRDIRTISAQGRDMSISDVTVKDENGKDIQFTTSQEGSNVFRIKIGSPDIFFTGQKTYVVQYKASRAISHLKDFDEIYWNVTGNDWNFLIASSSATVLLPDGAKEIDHNCYQGEIGSVETCIQTKDSTKFYSSIPLFQGQGLTIAVGFPKGVMTQEYTWKDNWNLLVDYYEKKLLGYFILLTAVLVPILFLLRIVSIFNKVKTRLREIHSAGNTLFANKKIYGVEYSAPKDVSPLSAQAILNHSIINTKGFIAEILYLVTKGYLKLTKISKEDEEDDFKLEVVRHISELPEYQRIFIKSIFKGKLSDDEIGLSVNVSDIEAEYKHTYEAQEVVGLKHAQTMSVSRESIMNEKVQSYLKEAGYFKKTANDIDYKSIIHKEVYFVPVLFVMIFVSFILMIVSGWYFLAFVLLIAINIVYFIFNALTVKLLTTKTDKGNSTTNQLLGLKRYIAAAEKDRLSFNNAPERTPKFFEQLLPYAMIFKLVDIWLKEFENMNFSSSDLSDTALFNSVSGFTSASSLISSVSDNFSDALSPEPVSTGGGSSSSSGSSGGGSSGGGGGGGGGGSW